MLAEKNLGWLTGHDKVLRRETKGIVVIKL